MFIFHNRPLEGVCPSRPEGSPLHPDPEPLVYCSTLSHSICRYGAIGIFVGACSRYFPLALLFRRSLVPCHHAMKRKQLRALLVRDMEGGAQREVILTMRCDITIMLKSSRRSSCRYLLSASNGIETCGGTRMTLACLEDQGT